MRTYVHYGHTAFDPTAFRVPRNREAFNKPSGGLWASPVDAEYGWRKWCADEDYCSCSEDNAFYFTLTETANIVHLNAAQDVEQLPLQKEYAELKSLRPVDFEALMQAGVDAVEFNLSKDYELYWALYGWDCDSILILNPEIIIPSKGGVIHGA